MAPHLNVLSGWIEGASVAVGDFHRSVQIVVKLQILVAIAGARDREIGNIAALGGVPGRSLRTDGVNTHPLRLLAECDNLPHPVIGAVEFIRQVVIHLRRHAIFIDADGGERLR